MKSIDRSNVAMLLQAIPTEVGRYISDFVARTRLAALLRSIAIAIVFAAVWTLSWALIDRLFALPSWLRLATLVAGIIGIIAILIRPAPSLLRRREIDWNAAAVRIESLDPRFEQRLITVTSQLLSPPGLRGSAQMLAKLIDEVAARTRGKRAAALVPTAPLRRAWVAAGAALLLLAILSLWPWLDLPALLLRQLRPLAVIAPVTQTRLTVEPGNAKVIDGQPLRITARADRLGRTDSDAVTLRLSGDGQTWQTEPMMPTIDGRFAFSLASLGHDYRYTILAGDARSPIYTIKLLRRPAVQRYRIHYSYPASLNSSEAGPADVVNIDGRIDAPAGTTVTISIEASEPLRAAALVIGSKRVRTVATALRNIREAKFALSESGAYRVELTSQQGVRGSAIDLPMRVILNEPPQALFTLPATRPLSGNSPPRMPITARPETAIVPGYEDALREYAKSLRAAPNQSREPR